jgi:two-component system NtrC family sensor kinase
MKKFLLSCWLGALATTAGAPSPATARLQAAVQAHPQADTGRVNRLNALAFAQRATAPKQTFAANQEALRLARQLHYAPGEAVALLGIGFYHRFRNEQRHQKHYSGCQRRADPSQRPTRSFRGGLPLLCPIHRLQG